MKLCYLAAIIRMPSCERVGFGCSVVIWAVVECRSIPGFRTIHESVLTIRESVCGVVQQANEMWSCRAGSTLPDF